LGTLALVAPYLLGGEQGDHVIFVWHTRTSDYVIGLHAWEPFTQAVSTLRAIVESSPTAAS